MYNGYLGFIQLSQSVVPSLLYCGAILWDNKVSLLQIIICKNEVTFEFINTYTSRMGPFYLSV